jgi:hypothetical protein
LALKLPKAEQSTLMITVSTEWLTPDAALSYRSSQLASSLAPGEHTLAFTAPGWAAVLDAPCTEVFTGFGAEEGFAANVESFVSSVDANPPEAYRGAASGESLGGSEKVVRMVIGWTSREAHLEAKEKPGGELRTEMTIIHAAVLTRVQPFKIISISYGR